MSEQVRAVAEAIHAVLRPAGFKRQRNAWRRDAGDFVDIVNLQMSKSLDGVSVDLGVIERDAYRHCWGRPVGATFNEAGCTVRTRLGVLVDGHDGGWSPSDPETADTIAASLRSVGLGWLEGMHSLTAIQADLEQQFATYDQRGYPPLAIALATIQAKNGDIDSACNTLDARRQSPLGAWQDRVEALAIELRCPSIGSGDIPEH